MQRSVTLKRFVFGSAVLCLAAAIALWLGVHRQIARPGDPQQAGARQTAIASFSQLPLRFEANHGQTNEQVKFLARGKDSALFLTANEAVLRWRAPGGVGMEESGRGRALGYRKLPAGASVTDGASLKLVNANPSPRISGVDELPGKTHYLIGNDPRAWRTNVSSFARVRYEEIYPGIDLIWYGSGAQLEYDFVVAPGFDPKTIRLAFTGVDAAHIADNGDLVLTTATGELRQHRPLIYQKTNGQEMGDGKQGIAGGYVMRRDGQVGFEIGEYDATRPLVIDPTIVYSTYLGGTRDMRLEGLSIGDFASDIAIDAAGNAYVAGYTYGADFPTEKPMQATRSNGPDAVVFKLNPAGNTLIYATYLGGNSFDTAGGIAVDGAGAAYLTGATESDDFPIVRPLQGTIRKGAGFGDAFIAKLKADGSALEYSTFFGGSGAESGSGIAVDAEGNAYVTGATFGASDLPLEKPLQPGYSGGACSFGGATLPCPDAFVTKLNATGSALVFSTYLGGNHYENSTGIAVDAQGQVTVAGSTSSTNFPTRNAVKGSFSGGACAEFPCTDAFVTKLTADGSALVFSTYLGGAQPITGFANDGPIDTALGVAADSSGNSYVTGFTLTQDFPLRNAIRNTNVNSEAFVTKFDPAGTLVYSTFLGGSGVENFYHVLISLLSIIGDGFNHCIAADAAGAAYVTGYTTSDDFPVLESAQANRRGAADVYGAKLNPAGTLAWSTYLGGGGPDDAFGIAVDATGNAYVVGVTNSTNFPVVNARQATLRGEGDLFGAKLGAAIINPTSVASVSAASFGGQTLAVESIVAAFGTRLATATQTANILPLPTTLAGSSVKVKDSAGTERLAPLFFVSSNQINYQIPPGAISGAATITVTSGDGAISNGTIQIAPVAPGLFAANANGQGVAAAVVLRVKADGAQSFEPVARFDPAQNRFVAVPIDLGAESDQVFLLLNGAGIRFRSSLSAVTARIGGTDAQVTFAGAQGQFVGLDQVNVRLPRSLIGRGNVDVTLIVDGQMANVVGVNFM
jgi:uncharacterized protein (TIGR03437 family)